MIEGVFFIFSFQLVGTAVTAFFGLPVPGPVIGMALLLLWLAFGLKTPERLEDLTDLFLRYLPLLFVPAAVGVMNYQEVILGSGLSLLVIIVVSTLIALLAAVVSFISVARIFSPPQEAEERSTDKRA